MSAATVMLLVSLLVLIVAIAPGWQQRGHWARPPGGGAGLALGGLLALWVVLLLM